MTADVKYSLPFSASWGSYLMVGAVPAEGVVWVVGVVVCVGVAVLVCA
jgi:hypothetical protein